MLTTALILLSLAAEPRPAFTSPKDPAPEYGHGLTAEQAAAGWISLFDGRTTFGWMDAKVDGDKLEGGASTSVFGDFELRAEVASPGVLKIGSNRIDVPACDFETKVENTAAAPIRLGPGLRVRSLIVRPIYLKSLVNGRDLTGWKAVRHAHLADDKQTKWSVADGAIHAVGGPGALESEQQYGDFVLQIVAMTRTKLVNGGLFFRSVPGDFMNGYEAQIFHACYGEDPARPARYSTGAIDDRQLARRVVTRDGQPFTMTVIAIGPHISTWTNGYQQIDWTDTRPPDANPRRGLRVASGTIQLQSHDAGSDLEFRQIRVVELK